MQFLWTPVCLHSWECFGSLISALPPGSVSTAASPVGALKELSCVPCLLLLVVQVTIPPGGGEFESVANHGSGMLVLGPGLNTSSLRINAASVGQVRAINVTASSLTYTGSG